jgi:hypothetical protein
MTDTATTDTNTDASTETPALAERDAVGCDVLQTRCALLERSVLKQSTTSPEKLAAQRPGGAENPDTSAMGWLSYLQWLSTEFGRGPMVPQSTSLRWSAQASDDLRTALAAEPITLQLESGREVAVHPKSLHALSRVAHGQLCLEWLIAHRVAVEDAPDPTAAHLALHRQAVDAEAVLVAEFVWIATHPGPGLPWDDNEGPTLPPAWTRDEITPGDVLRLQAAFAEVNLARVSTLSARVRALIGGGASDAAPLASFLGIVASEHGVRPEEIARTWSVAGAFAATLARLEVTERARIDADAKRATATR